MELKIHKNGNRTWFNSKGDWHRTDGPAVECRNGHKEWLVDGARHRTDGPAVERSNGYKSWWVNGKRHRDDGPACEDRNNKKNIEWYLEGKEYTEEEYKKEVLK